MCAALNLTAQVSSDSTAADTVALAPGPHHRANWLHRWLLGSNYRDLWTQPITVERLDLARLGGGLIPECLSGRPETALLDLRGADQPSYLFQPAGRGPSTSPLTVRPRRTPAADTRRDQAASGLPAGGLVVPPLLEAAGVLHTEPKLGILPETAALGPFGQVFAGMLGTVEQRPEAGFAGSDRGEDTEHVWAKIGASPGDRVDGRAYLTARLIDLLVGDADRAPDRWSWARYGSDRGHVWRPIPSGRDQAFARLDGVVLSVARRYLPQLVSFGPSYPDMYGLTWTARALDRRLLVALSKAEWDSIARSVRRGGAAAPGHARADGRGAPAGAEEPPGSAPRGRRWVLCAGDGVRRHSRYRPGRVGRDRATGTGSGARSDRAGGGGRGGVRPPP